MRLNKYISQATDLSRRAADAAIAEQRVRVNDGFGMLGQEVDARDRVTLDGKMLHLIKDKTTLLLHKPIGYIVSRDGQGNPTIYDLLPDKYRHLKPVGRLDKDSSGLLLLTDDGTLAHRLTHPSFKKEKVYEVTLDKSLSQTDRQKIEQGIKLEDGPSSLKLAPLDKTGKIWQITMTEGRNRQIRRTFAAADYTVTSLHRTQFGDYRLGTIQSGEYILITPQ